MARPKLQIHPVGIVIVVFGMLAWIIALGGVGAASYQCQTKNSYEICAKEYQWEWFTVWFQAACLLALLVTAFLERAFKRGQACLLAYFTLATGCVLLAAHNFITQVALGPLNVRDLGQDSVNAAAAGFVLLGVADFALLIVLGRDLGYAAQQQQLGGGRDNGGAYGSESVGIMQFQTSAPV